MKFLLALVLLSSAFTASAKDIVQVVKGDSAANKTLDGKLVVLYVTGAPANMLYDSMSVRADIFDETKKITVYQKMGESVSCFRISKKRGGTSFKCEITVEDGKVTPPAQG